MLLRLPKDVLKYILGIVIYDQYIVLYRHAKDETSLNLQRLTEGHNFDVRFNCSQLGHYTHNLSMVCPVFRQILKSVSKFDGAWWCFDRQLFHYFFTREMKGRAFFVG